MAYSCSELENCKKVSLSFDLKDALKSAKTTIREFRPQFRNSLEHLQVRALVGGLTNTLLLAFFEPENGEKTLIRVFGEGTEKLIDRDRELEILRLLSKFGCSGRVYGTFSNGMCYEYVKGSPITVDDIREPHYIELIASAVARLHSVPTPDNDNLQYGLFERIRKNFNDVSTKFCAGPESSYGIDLQSLRSDVDVIETMIQQLDPLTPAICHNDLTCGNLIHDPVEDRVELIDFEYAGINFVAYDIANHFCEYAGVENCDFSLFPTKEQQRHWIRLYLSFVNKFHGREETCTDKELDDLCRAVELFTLLSHLHWIPWAFVQHEHSNIDFDYMQYTKTRYQDYLQRRKEHLL